MDQVADRLIGPDATARGYVLATGEIVLQGTSRDLLENPEIQEAYLGKGLSG